MLNVEFGSPSPKVSVETSYHGIGKSHMVLQKSAMKELRRHLSFLPCPSSLQVGRGKGHSILVVTKSRVSQFSLVTPLNSLSDD